MDQPKIDDRWLEQKVKEVGLWDALKEAITKINAELEKLGLSGVLTSDLNLIVRDPDNRELAATGVSNIRCFNHTPQ